MAGYVRANPTEVPIVVITKFPVTVTIFGEGHILTSQFFPQGLGVNTDTYAEIL